MSRAVQILRPQSPQKEAYHSEELPVHFPVVLLSSVQDVH